MPKMTFVWWVVYEGQELYSPVLIQIHDGFVIIVQKIPKYNHKNGISFLHILLMIRTS